jgi:hypothetical protein
MGDGIGAIGNRGKLANRQLAIGNVFWHSVCSRDDRHDTEKTEIVNRAPAAYIP